MYRCIVIDDEPLALNVLAGFIRSTTGLTLVDVTTDPLNGLRRVQAGEADLVFLDIQMPEMSGIEFMRLSANQCKIILTTAYREFAIEGYEYNALDYLLKPIAYERFLKAIDKLPPIAHKAPEQSDHIFVKSEYKLLRLEINDILYLESLRDYVAVYTLGGNKILTLQSLASFEKELPAHLFCRIHKSYIIALNKISFIEKSKVVINNQYLPVGEFYKTDFWKRINFRQGSQL
jgi:two-component system LytT family response regulator